MKNLNFIGFLWIAAIGIQMTSCAQESTSSYKEITQSKVFQEYFEHKKQEMALLNKYWVIEIDENALTEKGNLSLEELQKLGDEKEKLIVGIRDFLKEDPVIDDDKPQVAIGKVVKFINTQEVDLRVKENVISLQRLILGGRERSLVEKILSQFPSIKDKFALLEILSKYEHAQP